MAKPIEHTFNEKKQRIIELFPDVLKTISMQLVGCHKRLGIISFRKHSGPLLYAHIVEKEKGSTHMTIAPGLSYLKEQNQSVVPEARIKRIFQKLEHAIKSHNNKLQAFGKATFVIQILIA